MGANDSFIDINLIAFNEDITAEKVRQFYRILTGDFVPRDLTTLRVSHDVAKLGVETARWLEVHTKSLFLDGTKFDPRSLQPTTPTTPITPTPSIKRNSILSGKTSASSSQPKFISIDANSLNFRVLGNDTPLSLNINGEIIAIDIDKTFTGVTAAPSTNNTMQAPASSIYDPTAIKAYIGEVDITYRNDRGVGLFSETFAGEIPFINIGTVISNKPNNNRLAFKNGNEIFTCIKNGTGTSQNFYNFKRRWAFIDNDNLCPNASIDSNTSVTFLNTGYVLINKQGGIEVVYTEPIISGAEPTTTDTNQLWLDNLVTNEAVTNTVTYTNSYTGTVRVIDLTFYGDETFRWQTISPYNMRAFFSKKAIGSSAPTTIWVEFTTSTGSYDVIQLSRNTMLDTVNEYGYVHTPGSPALDDNTVGATFTIKTFANYAESATPQFSNPVNIEIDRTKIVDHLPTDMNLWKRWNGTSFVETDSIPVAELYISSTKIEGYRCYDFSKEFNNTNTSEWELVDATKSYRSIGSSKVNVYGKEIFFNQLTIEAGTITNGISYYLYLKEDSTMEWLKDRPYYSESRRGYYHRGETWRCICSAVSDSGVFKKRRHPLLNDTSYFPYEKYNPNKDIPTSFYARLRHNNNSVTTESYPKFINNQSYSSSGGYSITFETGFFTEDAYAGGSNVSSLSTNISSVFISSTTSASLIFYTNNAITSVLQIDFSFSFSEGQYRQAEINNSLKG